jgi:hypothetical protein
MNGAARRTLYWTPRVLCIAFAAFTAIFALDVFQERVPAWQVAVALGFLYLLWARNKPFFGWDVVLLIAAPLFLVGVLFLLNWRYRAQLRPGS